MGLITPINNLDGGGNAYVSNTEKVSDTTIALNTWDGTLLLKNDTVVLHVAADNLSATTPTMSVTTNDARIGTWTQQAFKGQNATAAAGAVCAIFTATMTADGIATMTGIGVTLSGAVTAKAIALQGFRGASESLRSAAFTNSGASSGPNVGSDTTPQNGDAVCVCCAFEASVSPTGDSDTTNGSWEAGFGTTTLGGGSAANMGVFAQSKILTGAGVQDWAGSSGTSTDWAAAMIVLMPAYIAPKLYVAPSNAVHRSRQW